MCLRAHRLAERLEGHRQIEMRVGEAGIALERAIEIIAPPSFA